MQYSLKTLFVLFVVLGSSLAAFGPLGVVVTVFCVAIATALANAQPHDKTLLQWCGDGWRRWLWTMKTQPGARWGFVIAIAAILLVLLLLLAPWMRGVRVSSRAPMCEHKLKQIGLALHNYNADHGCFPPVVVHDNEGRPMHSWRTLILPYTEEANLHRRCDFGEPWDGPNNQLLHTEVVSTYYCPSGKGQAETQTNYFAVTGPHTAWPEGRGSRLDEFKDGLANTILLVEMADMDVHWMEPRDVTLDEALGPPDGETRAPQSRHYSEGGYFTRSMPVAGNILFADGSVRTVHKRLSGDDLAALVTIDGGENVDLDTLLEPTLAEKLRWERVVGLPLFVLGTIWFWLCVRADARAARESRASREDHRQDAEETD